MPHFLWVSVLLIRFDIQRNFLMKKTLTYTIINLLKLNTCKYLRKFWVSINDSLARQHNQFKSDTIFVQNPKLRVS